MKFKDYVATDAFRKFLIGKERQKRWRRPVLIGFAAVVLMTIGAIVCLEAIPAENESDPIKTVGYVLLGLAVAGMLVFSVIGSKIASRDNNGNRLPAYAAAMLLYAQENLSDVWRIENGLLTFRIEVSYQTDQKKIDAFSVIQKDETRMFDLSGFSDTIEMRDVLEMVLYGLFGFLERSAVQPTAVKCSVSVNGACGKEEFLYSNGKWKWLIGSFRRQYCRTVKYAVRKNLIA